MRLGGKPLAVEASSRPSRAFSEPPRRAHPVPLYSRNTGSPLLRQPWGSQLGSPAVPRARPKPRSPGRASPGSPCRTASLAPPPTCRLPPSVVPPGLRFPPVPPNRPPSSALPPPKHFASSTRPPRRLVSAHARPGYYMATAYFRCRPHLRNPRARPLCKRAPPSGRRTHCGWKVGENPPTPTKEGEGA